MSKEKRRVPKLRFPEFTEDWEQRKLGDVGWVKSGVGFPEKEQGGIEGIPFYKVSDMNHFDNQFEMIVANNYVSQNQIIKNRWSPISDSSAIIFAKVGAAVLLDRKRLCTNSFMLDNNMMAYIFYPEQLNKYFCKFLFDTINLGDLIQVGALPSLNAKDISDIKKYIPNLSEQNRIAKLLLSVETLITLHQRKLDNLKLKKKALLQKLFPKNGERYPELRFPGFTDAWEQRKLESILIEYTEKNPGNENLPVLTSSRQGLTKQEDHFGSVQRHDISDYNVIPLGFCTYRNRSDDKTFTFNINRIVPRGLVSKFYPVFEIKNGNADFITEYLNNNTEIIKSLAINAVGTSQVVLSLRTLRNIGITLPLKEEQVAIGDLMRKLDIYITLHQRKLDHLQLQKKALLQQMFV